MKTLAALRYHPTPFAFGAIALLALYSLTIPQNHTETEDAFDYAYRVRSGSTADLIFPHHLIYLPAARALYRTGLFPDAFSMMVRMNVLLGVGAVLLTCRVARDRFGLGAPAALVASAFLAFSYGFWRYSVAAEVYIPAIFVQALLCVAAFSVRDNAGHALLCGILASLTIVTHGPLSAPLAVLAVPMYYVMRRRFRTLGIYAAVATTVVFLAYYIGWRVDAAESAGLREFVAFIKGPPEDFRPFSAATLVKASLGLGATLTASNLVFAAPPLAARLQSLMPHRNVTEELFMTQSFNPWLAGLSLLLAIALAAVAIYMVTRLRFGREPRDRLRGRPVIVALVAWLVAYAALVIVVHPDSPELWICFLLPLALAIGVVLDTFSTNRALRAPLAFCGLLLACNLCGMAMIRAQSSDFNAHKAAGVLAQAQSGDDIYTRDADVFTRYLRYHAAAGVTVVNCWAGDATETAALLERPQTVGARRFVFNEVFEPPAYLASRNGEMVEGLLPLKEKLAGRLQPTLDPRVYLLKPAQLETSAASDTTAAEAAGPPLAR